MLFLLRVAEFCVFPERFYFAVLEGLVDLFFLMKILDDGSVLLVFLRQLGKLDLED